MDLNTNSDDVKTYSDTHRRCFELKAGYARFVLSEFDFKSDHQLKHSVEKISPEETFTATTVGVRHTADAIIAVLALIQAGKDVPILQFLASYSPNRS